MDALIVFNWYRPYRCHTKPNLEIADNAVMATKASGVQRYIASAVWCLGMTYFRLGEYSTSYDHTQEAYQLFNTFPPGEVDSQRLGGQCGLDFVESARFILHADDVVSFALDVEKSALPCPMMSYMYSVC